MTEDEVYLTHSLQFLIGHSALLSDRLLSGQSKREAELVSKQEFQKKLRLLVGIFNLFSYLNLCLGLLPENYHEKHEPHIL